MLPRALLAFQPRIRIYETPENAALARRMFSLRRRLFVLAAFLGLQLWQRWHGRYCVLWVR